MFKVSVKEYIKDVHVLYNKKTKQLKAFTFIAKF